MCQSGSSETDRQTAHTIPVCQQWLSVNGGTGAPENGAPGGVGVEPLHKERWPGRSLTMETYLAGGKRKPNTKSSGEGITGRTQQEPGPCKQCDPLAVADRQGSRSRRVGRPWMAFGVWPGLHILFQVAWEAAGRYTAVIPFA